MVIVLSYPPYGPIHPSIAALLDEVVPMHSFDNTYFLRSMIMRMTLRFDEILNVDKLHESLVTLVKKWQKLGARVQRRGYNEYNIRIMKRWNQEHPPVVFSEGHFSVSIKDHPLASQTLHQTDGPSIHAGVEKLRPLCSDGNGPTSLKDYVTKRYPQIHLHVVTFTDGTLVSLTWPHTMADCRGWADIFRAWSAMMSSSSNPLPRFMGYDNDTLAQFGNDDIAERSLMEPEKRNLTSLPGTFARQTACAIVEPRIVSRMFCLTPAVVQHIDCKTSSNMTEHLFVKEIDAIKGWSTNVVFRHLESSSRRVCIHSFFDLRERLPRSFPTIGVFIQNAMFPYLTQLRAKDLVHAPFGDTAVAIRKSFVEQSKPDQLAAAAKMIRASGMRDRYHAMGDPDGHQIYFVDWSSDGLMGAVDFSAAVEQPVNNNDGPADSISPPSLDEKGSANKGKPRYFQTQITSKSALHCQNVINLYGRDPDGNYWLGAMLHKREMKNLEEEIELLKLICHGIA